MAHARLWDIGDGVLQLEYTSKMNSMDPDILSMMEQSVDIVKGGFKGLVIGGSDSTNFSVGANLAFSYLLQILRVGACYLMLFAKGNVLLWG